MMTGIRYLLCHFAYEPAPKLALAPALALALAPALRLIGVPGGIVRGLSMLLAAAMPFHEAPTPARPASACSESPAWASVKGVVPISTPALKLALAENP